MTILGRAFSIIIVTSIPQTASVWIAFYPLYGNKLHFSCIVV